ncbi:MAG: DAK2 domain-containing protein [Dehalococcoidia bacterium]|nr:DAK2 domain-containing protein [Dehalococcoidia bacterium]
MAAVAEVELDGKDLKEALEGAELYIEQHVDEVNKLNIFPVPDGDTGVNMFLTIRAAVEEAEKAGPSAGEVAASAARGALLGARGNSGVILSQIMRGAAKGLEGREAFSFADFARALHIASEQAYKSVEKPVEGTILTVIREVSEEAAEVATKKTSFVRAINKVVSKAGKTVKKTPEMLPVLKEAGVVDAGAKGLYYFFKGMESSICRKSGTARPGKKSPVRFSVKGKQGEERVYGFDVQFLLEGEDLPVEEIKKSVIAAGECPLVVGDESLLKVHVHTMNPDEILDYARGKGEVKDIVVEDMDAQVKKRS